MLIALTALAAIITGLLVVIVIQLAIVISGGVSLRPRS